MHDRDAVGNREDAALAAENAILNVIAIAPMEHRRDEVETPPQYGHRRMSRVVTFIRI